MAEELSDFQRGTVIGCHLSNKSVLQIAAKLELPWSTVSAVIVKWKRLGETTAQPRSDRPYQLTEWLQHSLPSSKLPLDAVSPWPSSRTQAFDHHAQASAGVV
jgi:transposase